MLPKANLEQFKKTNTGLESEAYIQYVETRLNNRLLLLSNPELMTQLGLDPKSVVAETKRLVSISNYIEIPTVVDEDDYNNRMQFRNKNITLWEPFSDYYMSNFGRLPNDVDTQFASYVASEKAKAARESASGAQADADSQRRLDEEARALGYENHTDRIGYEQASRCSREPITWEYEDSVFKSGISR